LVSVLQILGTTIKSHLFLVISGKWLMIACSPLPSAWGNMESPTSPCCAWRNIKSAYDKVFKSKQMSSKHHLHL